MRIADRVHYLDADGTRRPATITAVPGTGKSGAKTLNLTLADGTALTDVPHEKDAETGAGFWRELGASAIADTEDEVEAVAPPKPKPKRRSRRKKT